jgi:solute:Na+ symporter, SSS family
LSLLGPGLKGLSFAALTAAIVASLAGKANSIATIFTLDIYKKYFNKDANDDKQVGIGRIVILVAMGIAVLVAPQLRSLEQGFQFVQEFTGMISPGVVAIFLLGFFWKRATAMAALVAALITIPLGFGFKAWMPEVPFLDRMGIIFCILVGVMAVISLLDPSSKNNPKAMEVNAADFRTSQKFAIGTALVLGILVWLYIVFW